jgi:redox-sensitive bicupin YhaK (pirin superfamily)
VRAGAEINHELERQKRAYLLATDAAIRVNGAVAQAGDRVLVTGGGRLTIEALAATEVVLLEV